MVQLSDGIVVWSYNLVSHIGMDFFREQSTEFYRKGTEGEREIMYNHWSLIQTLENKE